STPSAINAFLAGGGLPQLGTRQLGVGLFPTTLDETEVSAKLTHQLNPRQSVIARAALTRTDESADAFTTGGLTDLSARGSSHTRDVAFTGSWTTILGPKATNELRGQVATRRVTRRTTDHVGAGILIPGLIEFGRSYSGNDRTDQTYGQIGDT